MDTNFFKKEKVFSYRKNRISNNQQTNILKTYNNINNEIIINIKNNEKYNIKGNKDKKYEVRRIRLKLPNEIIHKNNTLDFLNLNLRNSNYSNNITHSKQTLSNGIYNESMDNKMNKPEKVNTFLYNKKPLYHMGVYHKINNLSFRSKKESSHGLNKNKNSQNYDYYDIKKTEDNKINYINSKNNFENNKNIDNNINNNNINNDKNKNIYIKNPRIIKEQIYQNKYKKIKPLKLNKEIRDRINPINVNRKQKFYSSNTSQITEESISNINNTNNHSKINSFLKIIPKNNIIQKTRNAFNRKSFRFLVNETNKNSDLSISFSKFYNKSKNKKPVLNHSQLLSNNDSISFSNNYNETEINNENESLCFNDNNLISANKSRSRYNTQKNISDIIPNKKSSLKIIKTSKYHMINNTISNPSFCSPNINSASININIYYIQEKMKIVYDKIKNYEKCDKECFNFLKFFFDNDMFYEITKFFLDEKNKKSIENYMKVEILCYFLCYNICLGDNFKVTEILLKSIFDILFNNFILFLNMIVSQNENKNDNIIIVLNKIIKDNLNKDLLPYDTNNLNLNENNFIDIIKLNTKSILDYYKIIISNIYKDIIINDNNFPECLNKNTINLDINELNNIKSIFFNEAFKNINDLDIILFKKFFYSFLCFDENKNINNSDKNINNIANINIKKDIYFLPEMKDKSKKYSLILDLDDTLIHSKRNFHFKLNRNNSINQKRSIIFRPYLFKFLDLMKPLYELILFSSSTPDYVDPIVKLIEKDKKYFDFILYRHHITLDEDGNNVKNLEKIGRDLTKIIIVDDIERYFKLQKDNGINIKPFCGNLNKETNTLNTLGDVLVKIRNDAEETNDIRISLNKVKKLLYPDVVDKLENMDNM